MWKLSEVRRERGRHLDVAEGPCLGSVLLLHEGVCTCSVTRAGLATGAAAAPTHPWQGAEGTGVTAALTQGAGPGSHPAGAINTANCLPCLEPSLPSAWGYTQALNPTVRGQPCFSNERIRALWQEQKAWQCFISLTK